MSLKPVFTKGIFKMKTSARWALVLLSLFAVSAQAATETLFTCLIPPQENAADPARGFPGATARLRTTAVATEYQIELQPKGSDQWAAFGPAQLAELPLEFVQASWPNVKEFAGVAEADKESIDSVDLYTNSTDIYEAHFLVFQDKTKKKPLGFSLWIDDSQSTMLPSYALKP